MLIVADAITALITMHYKYKFKRPRPTQIVPGFMSPIQHGGHAMYPSGHSTEAHVFATLLTKVIHRHSAITTSDGGSTITRALNVLATELRESRNRRPSLTLRNTCAGITLANAITSKHSSEWIPDDFRSTTPKGHGRVAVAY